MSPADPSEDDAWGASQPGINFDAALLAGTLGVIRRSFAAREAATLGTHLARRPQAVAAPLARLGARTARIATRRSDYDPARRDRRYTDAGWRGNPIFKALAPEPAAIRAPPHPPGLRPGGARPPLHRRGVARQPDLQGARPGACSHRRRARRRARPRAARSSRRLPAPAARHQPRRGVRAGELALVEPRGL